MERKTVYKKKKTKSIVTSTGNRLRVVEGNAGKKKRGLQSLKPAGGIGKIVLPVLLAIFIMTAFAAGLYIQKHYHVEHLYVEGNIHYTDEEIIEFVTSRRFGDNSLCLFLRYRDRGIEGIPFIEKMDVKVLAPDTVRITVYEKAVAGYVEYLDRYMYFDRDGIIVEASEMKTAGIPEITGISFDQVIMHEPLPVENQTIFKKILSMTQILSKYGISADRIYFDKSYEMTLYFGDVRARLGNDDNIEEKVGRLQQILPAAEGKKGVFRLEGYTGSGENVSFEQDT